MTNSPNPENQSNSDNNNRKWLMVRRGSFALGGLALVGLAGGAWRLWVFVHKDLVPLAESSLTTTLNRPVKLGEVKEISLTGLEFGASAVPATSTDPARASVDSVEVGFDPLQLLFHRTLKLDVTLVDPDVYLQQDQQGRWINTKLAPPGKQGPIKTVLDKIWLRNAKVVLLPYPKAPSSTSTPRLSSTPVTFSQLNGSAQLLNNNELAKFDVGGQADSGGDFSIKGDARLKTLESNLQLRGQDLVAADIGRLVTLPLDLQAGRVQGDLNVHYTPQQQQQFSIQGSASVQGVQAQVPKAPQPFINSQGNLRFQGTQVQLDNMRTSFGKIPLVANGTIDTKTGYKIAARVNAVSLANAQETLKLKLPVSVTGEVKADVQVVGASTQPILKGTVTSTKPAIVDKVNLKSFRSKFVYSPTASVINLNDIQAQPTIGGEVTGGGTIQQLSKIPQLNLNFTAKNLSGDGIASAYDIKAPIKLGIVSATAQVTGVPSKVQTQVQLLAPNATYPTNGQATIITQNKSFLFRDVAFNVAGGKVQGSGSWANQQYTAIADASQIEVERFIKPSQLQNISLNNPLFNGRIILSGKTGPFTFSSIRTENAKLQIAGGTVAVSNVQLQDQNFAAKLVADNLYLGQILKQAPPALSGPLAGTFQIAGNTNALNIKNLRATGEAGLPLGGGRVNVSNIRLEDGVYQARVQANNLQLSQLAPQVPKQFQGSLTGEFNVAGSAESVQPQTLQATGEAQLNVAGGKVTASNIQLAEGRYQADIATSGVELNRFSQQLQGQLGTKLQVAGNILDTKNLASLKNIQAAGQVQLSKGIPGFTEPLTAVINWDGEKLALQRATARDLNVSGYISANAQKPGVPEITDINLNVQAQNYNLQKLPVKLPSLVALTGMADFSGQVTGKLPVPNVQGQLRLRNLVVNNLAFEPVLSGNVQAVRGQGASLDLTGTRDRIAASLDANNSPESFTVKWENAIAQGQSQGENLAVKVDNFPLAILKLTPPPNTRLGTATLAGLLNANIQVNKKTYATVGSVAVAKPQVGRIVGDSLQAQFSYNNGTANLISSEFNKGNSRYALAATLTQTPKGPRVQGKVNVTQGQIQDVLTALQLFDMQDFRKPSMSAPIYGKAADISTDPVGLPEQPLYTQLQRFAEIEALQTKQQQERRNNSLIPNLADLKGTFNAEASVDTASANGLSAQFDVNSQNIVWGKENEPDRLYKVEQLIARGGFEKGVLTLQPLRIESDKRLIAFTGKIGSTVESGQLQVSNFPIQVLNNFVKLPFGLTGNLDATAAISGSLTNPQAQGQLQIADATLNQKPLESAIANFGYNKGRLSFGSKVLVSGAEPLTIAGSIPYKLPFASVAPDTDQISLEVKVKNEGLALLNLFTNQVVFDNGQGQVDLTVRGTLKKPLVNGFASINNATFSAQALPEKLTNVTGNARFNLDQVVVENFQGKFSQGTVAVKGELPIFNNEQTTNKGLNVNLNQLAVNLKGLYKGGVNGDVQITGSVLNPTIGGDVQLADGKVLLLASANVTSLSDSNSLSITPDVKELLKQTKPSTPDANDTTPQPQFNNLRLTLGQKVDITRPPILNFQASGTLTVNGPLKAPVPEGTIRLTGGSLNLFSTQFTLARNSRQTATFTASQPRDPNLNISLTTKVLDANPSQFATTTSPFSSEINQSITTNIDTVNSVSVDARIQGPASQINNGLELTSNPSYSKSEIVALLGGTFIQTLGRGDSTLGLANLASSALNIQQTFSQIGNALGLSEFRLYPTLSYDTTNTRRNASTSSSSSSSLDLAAEAGVDINRNFYFSVLKILTTSDPPQFGFNYRLNSKIRVRTSTNLSDDTRAAIEYNTRF
ncbi:MAG: translocation/assembly module TamB domain-containing protein [Rhizonema sp. PD37]|nr:translocation/assembly module TamB domain-containing protein [Rhizonema sp. PD37]